MASLVSGEQNMIGGQCFLWTLIGANMNTTADQALIKGLPFTSYNITDILVTNASTSLTLAAGGFYTSTGKGGTAIVAAGQVYSALTGTTKTLAPTIAVTDIQSGANLYFSLTVAQGGAATADIYVCGYALS